MFVVDYKKSLLQPIGAGISKQKYYMPGEVIRSQCGVAKAHQDLRPEKNCTCGVWAVKSRKLLHTIVPPTTFGRKYQKEKAPKVIDFGQFSGGPYQLILPPSWPVHRMVFGHEYHQNALVSARVQLWGRVIEHQAGYRAEFAKIMGHTIQWYPRKHQHKPQLLQYLRERYSDG